ncbi:MAG: hypothetical protein ABR585_03500 [Gemmatimonadaceae bacterium]
MNHYSLLVMASIAALSCGKSEVKPSGGDSTLTRAETPTPLDTSPAGSTRNECPRTGKWALCSVEKRLEQSGFVVRRVPGNGVRRPGFSITPEVYALGRSRLEVFIYPDEATLKKDIAGIDTVTAAPRGAKTAWETTPTFLRSANLAAVFLTDNRERAERLTLALTAGAPQPISALRLSPVKSK